MKPRIKIFVYASLEEFPLERILFTYQDFVGKMKFQFIDNIFSHLER